MTKPLLLIIAIITVPVLVLSILVGSALIGVATGVGSVFRESAVDCKVDKDFWTNFDVFSKSVSSGSCNDVCPTSLDTTGTGTVVSGGFTAAQIANIKEIIGTGKALKIPQKGIVIAIDVAMVESGLQNYANDGIYDTSRNPADSTIAGIKGIFEFSKTSLDYPHEAVGSDASSVGLFQQQAWWGTMGSSTWQTDPKGTMKRLMDPVFGSQQFYSRLVSVSGWESLPPGTVAQTIQGSARPEAYATKIAEASATVNTYYDSATEPTSLYPVDGGTGTRTGAEASGDGTLCGSFSLPLDKNSLYQVTAQWGQPRSYENHPGMDIDCGNDYENVYSMSSGTVVTAVAGNESGYGTPMGQISILMSDGSKITYMHGRHIFVKVGDTVSPGEAITECASTGNSTGTHLHIEFDTTNSTNASLKDLPSIASLGGRRDPALAMDILGLDICPPYTANRKTVGPGAALPSTYVKCWPQNEWVR